MDIDTPGTYNITYTVLGTDGSMEEAERLAKVLETAETTPVPSEEVVETPAPEEDVATDTGNVEKVDVNTTVKTGDDTNMMAWLFTGLAGIVVCITGIASLLFGNKRKKL